MLIIFQSAKIEKIIRKEKLVVLKGCCLFIREIREIREFREMVLSETLNSLNSLNSHIHIHILT